MLSFKYLRLYHIIIVSQPFLAMSAETLIKVETNGRRKKIGISMVLFLVWVFSLTQVSLFVFLLSTAFLNSRCSTFLLKGRYFWGTEFLVFWVIFVEVLFSLAFPSLLFNPFRHEFLLYIYHPLISYNQFHVSVFAYGSSLKIGILSLRFAFLFLL